MHVTSFATIAAEIAGLIAAAHLADVNHDPEAAARLVDELQRRVDGLLTQFPKAGTRAASGRRFETIRRHAVLYRHDAAKGEVVVLDVFGPRVDWR